MMPVEDYEFLKSYFLVYLKSLKFDNYIHWSEEDLNFYNEKGYSLETKDQIILHVYKVLKKNI